MFRNMGENINKLYKDAAKATKKLQARLEMFNINLEEHGFNQIEHIKTRIKEPESVKKKLARHGYDYTYHNIKNHIKDIGGVRAITLFVEDIYRIRDYIYMQKDFEILEETDYIKNPKESGYRSLHLNIVVPVYENNAQKKVDVELQIRTVGMDFFASVEHKLRYKAEAEIPADIQTLLQNCSSMVAELDTSLRDIVGTPHK